MSLYESIKNNLNESRVKTQDFINDLNADNIAMRAAGISGDTMTFEQYQKYQDALHEIRKNDTGRYEITIDYWDKNWNAKDKTYVGRSLKEIAKKFVKAKENLDFDKVSDYSDNLYELLDKSDYSSIEDYLEAVAKGEVSKMSESSDDAYMEEWRSICEAFCKKIGAKLLFVNTDNFGYEDKNGNLVHMYADELEQFIKNGGLKESSVWTPKLDTHVDPRSKVDGWKVKVLDVIPDDYAGSTVAKVELFDPEGNSQGEDTIYIHRQKVKIGNTYDAYIDGIMAMPRIKGVPDFTLDEVPDMKKVSRDMYLESDSSDNYTVYLTIEVEPGKYETSVYGTYSDAEQANDVVNELHGRGVNASVVQGDPSFVDTGLKTNHGADVVYSKDMNEHLTKHTNDQGKNHYSSLSDDEFIEADDSQLYVFHDVKSDNREDAASWIHNFRSEAPKLDFKLSQPYPNELWSVDFIGKKQDIEDYLIKLGYYTKDEIDKYKCIEPYDSSLY